MTLAVTGLLTVSGSVGDDPGPGLSYNRLFEYRSVSQSSPGLISVDEEVNGPSSPRRKDPILWDNPLSFPPG